VAVLAIELTFPTATAGEAAAYEPWTAASRWEQALIAKVQGFGGVLLQRSPALLLAAFGIPQTLEQLPQRAVQTALALRQLVAEGADQVSCAALRLVVHWGEVVVDVLASDPTAHLRALGDTLAWPVRLLGQTAPGEIVISPEMGRLVEGWCEVQPREVPLQGGQPGLIGVYAVVGNRPPRDRWARQGRRALSPFVGRERELAMLRERVCQVEGGRGQVVGVFGDPGTGKSRLCDELVRGALAPPWLILHTQGTAVGQATPYQPLLDLLKDYFHLDGLEDLPTIRDQVMSHLRCLDDRLTPTVPAFLTLLEVPVEDLPWQRLEAAHRRQRTLEALRGVLVRESQAQPVLLLVEDLHWIDTETQAFLDTLVDSLPTARLLLLVNYRSEYRHNWGHKTAYTPLRLDPLPSASAEALLRALLGDDPSLIPLKTRLTARTEGNPFFLEESVCTLVEAGVLVGEHGAYRMTQDLPSLQVPATVQAVLAARIDRLPPEEKRLLQTAAVIGTEVPVPLLHTITELSEDSLHRGLARLQAAEFLYETRLFPEPEYTFKHTLTHEVAYSSLLLERRRGLHARLVEAIEALMPERAAEQVERLAHHALRGGLWEKAVTYYRQAGARAHDRAAFREAVAAFEQALHAITHLPEDGETRRLAIDLRLMMGGSLSQVGEHGRRLALLGEAEALARELADRMRLVRVLSNIAMVLRVTGNLDGAVAAGQQARTLPTDLGDSALQREASLHLGQAYYARGDFGRAAELLRRNVEAADRESGTPKTTSLQIQSLAWLAWTLSALGAFVEGRRHGKEALRLAMQEGRGTLPVTAHACLGDLYLAQGDLEHAMRVLEQGLALCRASGNRNWSLRFAAALGSAAALQGRLAEGRALLQEAISDSLRMGLLYGQADRVARLSEVCRLVGRGDEAWQHARQALDLARQLKERGSEAYALHQLGAVQTHADPLDAEQAEANYQQALALGEALGMRPLVAHCHLGLGKLYADSGRRAEARAALTTAIKLYTAMDMTFWLPEAEAALGQCRG
jgi:predicted ATPase